MAASPLPASYRTAQRTVTVVLPAFNEAQGLPDLLDRLGSTLNGLERPYRIIVVDDGSCDGTALAAKAAGARLPIQLVRHGQNQGLGRAMRTGLLAAMRHGGPVITMDADNSHDPELIPSMLAQLEHGFDVVIASRYVDGGKEIGVAAYRRVISRTASGLLRRLKGLTGVRDYSSGYRAYRSSIIARMLKDYGSENFVSQPGFACMVELLLKAKLQGARITEVPLVLRYDRKQGRSKMPIARTIRQYGSLLLDMRAHASTGRSFSDRSCRMLNLTAAVAGLILAAPAMILIGAAVRLTSPGPIMYTQPRIGADRRARERSTGTCRRRVNYCGRPFRIYKFRTMRVSESVGPDDQVWASPEDPRVTPLGRFLRRFRLDELPQLFNVLAGDMNVVGPRPEQPGIVMHLRERIQDYDERHRVPPGITGWAQINQHYDRSIEDVRRKVLYDLEYVSRRSAMEDFKIMLRTVPVMIFRRGAW